MVAHTTRAQEGPQALVVEAWAQTGQILVETHRPILEAAVAVVPETQVVLSYLVDQEAREWSYSVFLLRTTQELLQAHRQWTLTEQIPFLRTKNRGLMLDRDSTDGTFR